MWVQFGPGGPELFGRLKLSSSGVTGPGAEVTTGVALELLIEEPALFVAVTETATVKPTSADPAV
jgi:hypothetical protein